MNLLRKMLIVDDDEVNRAILVTIFHREFQIEAVDSGEAALQAIGDFKPNIVMLDIMMPGFNGYEVCAKMREDPSLAAMKIIMVSARAYEEEQKKGLEAGADDYITKPFSVDDIKKVVEKFMAGA
ncbi:MAG: response regulator [Gammaproteobacteria bacterium]|nr:response regulator [Gammaproteobacteria bacterium]